ncbi:tRNA (N6-threonylcarbamoyladenosine(37)-N6)-methyltransferase TrmO [Actinomadura opuntiae]|uniref:tRNA (N6-threonylcarbamoyladenosine(37)-N6)-methyltransferase TrmO n=1 Tax=Actinomadura sp. OS1-43 TaxID=604315 RepID=UPI00255AB7BC|nr:tRNA (N6-threonylcarbamoyladenosine(37)-N6)-methyltransferase TrmO [Actinomadura sp. OS1-43]MDL4812922.1 tRNA (N6-threonylcarbamoyladenosine(37)-N6)-methyltransferase TrmO [Actinomadura sp. OS1-43]
MRNVQGEFVLTPVGHVSSELKDRADAPKQGTEGAPDAWLVFEPPYVGALEGLGAGDRVIVLTWLHLAPRDVLRTRPRDDPANPETGVFATRSPARPNPVGLHPVEILQVTGRRLRVRGLEALDGTPVLDLKPVIGDVPGL